MQLAIITLTMVNQRIVLASDSFVVTYYVASAIVDYGQGTPILPLNFECDKIHNSLGDCSTRELNVSQCTHVAGVDCRGLVVLHMLERYEYNVCFAAPCITSGLTNCSQCMSGCYNSNLLLGFDCSCNSNCFSYGTCCSDIFVEDICFGKENTILKERNITKYPPAKECKHGAVRLVGGLTNSTGRLEFCAHGMWGRVCNALKYWGSDNARVVCRQLGFSEEGE